MKTQVNYGPDLLSFIPIIFGVLCKLVPRQMLEHWGPNATCLKGFPLSLSLNWVRIHILVLCTYVFKRASMACSKKAPQVILGLRKGGAVTLSIID